MNIADLQSKTDEELQEMARELGLLEDGSAPKREGLMMDVLRALSERNGNVMAAGILSVTNEGYGFLKSNDNGAGSGDVYVSQSQIRRFNLRNGDQIGGQVRPPKDGERYFSLVRVEAVNGVEPDAARDRPKFEQ